MSAELEDPLEKNSTYFHFSHMLFIESVNNGIRAFYMAL